MDVDEDDPTIAHVIEIRDKIAEIIATGTFQERKSTAKNAKAIRARPPPVGRAGLEPATEGL